MTAEILEGYKEDFRNADIEYSVQSLWLHTTEATADAWDEAAARLEILTVRARKVARTIRIKEAMDGN